MVNLELLYSIAESSGALVAIVAAFFTTKILTIASESRTVRNHIELLDAELKKRWEFAEAIQKDIDAIERDWAEEDVKDFYNRLYDELESGSAPTLDEVCRKFEEIEERTPNKDEREFLEEGHSDFLKRLARKGEGFPWFDERDMTKLLMIDRTKEIRKEYDELRDKLHPEIIAISILEARLREYREQIEALAFPRYVKFGFFSFAYFAVVGVIVPLAVAAWTPEVNSCLVVAIFSLFLTGLGTMFSYLFLEIRDALGQKAEAAAMRTEQAER